MTHDPNKIRKWRIWRLQLNYNLTSSEKGNGKPEIYILQRIFHDSYSYMGTLAAALSNSNNVFKNTI